MNYYAIQVKTREEKKFLALARNTGAVEPYTLVFPRRTLTIRRLGKNKTVEAPIFPGYIFFEAEQIDPDMYWRIKRISGFFRFLKSNQDIRPLEGKDLELLLHFLSFGEVVKKSKVRFDENSRIVIIQGPLKGLEGLIVKVDKRKGRAKLQLDMYTDTFLVDLGIEFLEEAEMKVPGGEKKGDRHES
jgi:transcriptional antiterminator NusG